MSPAFLERAKVYQPSSNPDTAACETIALMTTYIRDSARDPLVQAEARRAVKQFPSLMALAGLTMAEVQNGTVYEQAAAESCWSWAKHNLEFVHHSKLLLLWLGNKDALQLLISPDVIVHALNGSDSDARSRARKGDCAVFSPMICALLEALGLDWELVIAAVDRSQPEIFSHIWPRVVLSDGRRVSLDASHGKYPGWHVPAYDIHRLQVFDSYGNAIADAGGTFTGLHNYMPRGMGTDLSYWDQFTDAGVTPQTWDQAPVVSTPAIAPAGGGGGFNWNNTIGGLLNQWTQIGARVIAPQTSYQVGPGGQISYTTPGSASRH